MKNHPDRELANLLLTTRRRHAPPRRARSCSQIRSITSDRFALENTSTLVC